MLAILYLVVAFFAGWVIKRLFRIDTLSLFSKISGGTHKLPPLWTFDIPFSLIVGVTIMTTVHYYTSFLFSLVLPSGINPLLASNIAFIAIFMIFIFLSYDKIIKKFHLPRLSGYFSMSDAFYWKTLWFFGLFSIFLIFYSFFVYRGVLNSGYTVFSDFAPNTAIINSFAKGNNFPTQYPHFSNDGIKYHFMFFYLCGNLEFLGLRIDLAMNIPSILGIITFTMLLGCLGVLITKRKWVFFLAPFMLFFRSSYAIFSYLQELVSKKGSTFTSVLLDILKTNKFIGQTLHDDWGLWNINVYANQRHFLWGFSIMLIILFLFFPSIRTFIFNKKTQLQEISIQTVSNNKTSESAGFAITTGHIDNLLDEHPKIIESKIQDESSTEHSCELEPSIDSKNKPSIVQNFLQYFIDPTLWKIENSRVLILCILLVACLPYWHGSMLISLFCILFALAFFSKNRLSFILLAFSGVASALLQAKFFSGGAQNVANPEFLWGFLATDKSLIGVMNYLFQVLGISFVFLLILPFIQEKFNNRVFLIASISPMVFALCISLTPDVTVNHKYILIGFALLNIFIADAYCTILKFVKDSFHDLRSTTSHLSKRSLSAKRTLSTNEGYSTKEAFVTDPKFSKIATQTRSFSRTPPSSQTLNTHPLLVSQSKTKSMRNFISHLFSNIQLPKKIIQFVFSLIIAILISFSLFATGVPEIIGYINKNVATVKVDLNSPVTKWIEENTDPKDVFLTAPYHMNEFFFSGRKVFYGWAYFSWSAGHDTATRDVIVKKMFRGYDGDLSGFVAMARLQGIRYAIIDTELLSDKWYSVNIDFFKVNFKVAASFPTIRNTTIYQLY